MLATSEKGHQWIQSCSSPSVVRLSGLEHEFNSPLQFRIFFVYFWLIKSSVLNDETFK